jgi:hypothetical protein
MGKYHNQATKGLPFRFAIFEKKVLEIPRLVWEGHCRGPVRMGRQEVVRTLFRQDFLQGDSGLFGAEFVAAGQVRHNS